MLEFLTILLMALASLWIALLVGVALGIAPVPLALALTLGYSLSVALVLWAGAPLRQRLLRLYDLQRYHALRRYGVIGLALLAPVVTGAHLGAAVGLACHIAPRRLLIWMTAGAALWSIALLIATLLGVHILA